VPSDAAYLLSVCSPTSIGAGQALAESGQSAYGPSRDYFGHIAHKWPPNRGEPHGKQVPTTSGSADSHLGSARRRHRIQRERARLDAERHPVHTPSRSARRTASS